VTAFDVSPRMLQLARERLQGEGTLFLGDLSQPLALEAESFDLVASSLAIDYVRDWSAPLKEFWRVLKPKGRLVFSVQHPLSAYLWYQPPSAVGVHYVEGLWKGFGGEPVLMPDYWRSFEAMIRPLLEAGFAIRDVRETLPIEALRERDAAAYEKFMKLPPFLCFEALKP
jgi:SAM-dependent methyltransferase